MLTINFRCYNIIGDNMLEVYKKVDKNIDNPYGLTQIENLEELEKPFLICLSAQDKIDKSIFGMMKEGARAARVYTTDEDGAGFKLEDFPVDFIGLKFQKDENFQNNYEEITDTFIYPYLMKNKKDINEIKKAARRINFMTYCNGTLTYAEIENRLKEKLEKDGYTEQDTNDILSQVSLTAIGTEVNTKDLSATTVAFIDVNDTELEDIEMNNNVQNYKKHLENNNFKSHFGYNDKENNLLYVYEGTGEHYMKDYMSDENIAKPAISAVVSKFLQNSIDNENKPELIELSNKQPLDMLLTYGNSEKNTKERLDELDKSLDYNGASKYTEGELKLRKELDLFCKKSEQLKIQNERNKKELATSKVLLDNVQKSVEQYSSETGFYQILCSAGMWQEPTDRNVFEEASDKQIRQIYSQMLEEQKTIDENVIKM